jgi:hypothetical protein
MIRGNTKGLDLLRINHAGIMVLKDGSTVNYGVIRINNNREVVYYTGKGLREMMATNIDGMNIKKAEDLKHLSEQELIQSEHIKVTPFDNIERVVF